RIPKRSSISAIGLSSRPDGSMRAAATTRFILVGAALAAATLAAGQSTPAEQTAYFLGEVKTVAPSGQPLSTSLSLVRRVLRPAENRIVEIVATIDSGKPVREFTTTF